MEKEKYYTPSEDEFFVGFEYEKYEHLWVYDIKPIDTNSDGSIEAKVLSEPKQVVDWRKRTYKLDDFCYVKDGELECWYNPEVLRVKYLDSSDIESFEFKMIITKSIGKDVYVKSDKLGVIYIEYDYLNNKIAIFYPNHGFNPMSKFKDRIYHVFDLTIKNKSELSRLLKQLSII